MRSPAGRNLGNDRRLSYTTREGVKRVPITITFHPFHLTVTVKIAKRDSRHSAK